jgi:hypothetical protein
MDVDNSWGGRAEGIINAQVFLMNLIRSQCPSISKRFLHEGSFESQPLTLSISTILPSSLRTLAAECNVGVTYSHL